MDKAKKSRDFLFDIFSIILSIFAVIFSILVFIDTKTYNALFVVVFIISSIICYIRGIGYIRKKEKIFDVFLGISLLIIFVFLIIMAILSLITL